MVYAIFSQGVFRPEQKIDLPENTRVVFEPRVVHGVNTSAEGMEEIYRVLSERFDGGDPRVAERHNEHQP